MSIPPREVRFPWLQLAFVGVLLLVGVGFLALAVARAYFGNGAPPPPDLAEQAEADLAQRGYKPLSEPLQRLLDDPAYRTIPTQANRLLGEAAPLFELTDTDDKPWTLEDALKAGPVVLVFYYGYHCNHCVSQLFGLNKDIDKFRELGAIVVAVSADKPEVTRSRFATYGAFAFPVLSDPGNKVAQKYGVFRPTKDGKDGDLLHGTFVINRQGRVVWANRGDEPFVENRTLLVEIHRSRGEMR